MRTVEQVVSDYEKATESVRQAQLIQAKYKEELKEIHNAVATYLGRTEVKPREIDWGEGNRG